MGIVAGGNSCSVDRTVDDRLGDLPENIGDKQNDGSRQDALNETVGHPVPGEHRGSLVDQEGKPRDGKRNDAGPRAPFDKDLEHRIAAVGGIRLGGECISHRCGRRLQKAGQDQ